MPYVQTAQGVFGAPPPGAFGPPGLPARPPGGQSAWPPQRSQYGGPPAPGSGASTVDELIAGAAAAAGHGNAAGAGGDDIDRLIRMAEAGIRAPPSGPYPIAAAPGEDGTTGGAADADDEEAGGAGAGKKKKDKSGRMIYADSDVSPEERLAEMARYRWIEA